jgi:hypothetical protein
MLAQYSFVQYFSGMKYLSCILVLMLVSSCARPLIAWSRDEMIVDVLMLKSQGWKDIKVDTCEDGTYRIQYK